MEFGKRYRMTLTRAGWIEQAFYVCYECPAELAEHELTTHNH
jgi:uncharacterized CHY-type Zn-finger protein